MCFQLLSHIVTWFWFSFVLQKLINISGDVINLHIIPPQTKYFQIKYNKTVSVRKPSHHCLHAALFLCAHRQLLHVLYFILSFSSIGLSLACHMLLLLISVLMSGGITMTASEFIVR